MYILIPELSRRNGTQERAHNAPLPPTTTTSWRKSRAGRGGCGGTTVAGRRRGRTEGGQEGGTGATTGGHTAALQAEEGVRGGWERGMLVNYNAPLPTTMATCWRKLVRKEEQARRQEVILQHYKLNKALEEAEREVHTSMSWINRSCFTGVGLTRKKENVFVIS